jgi:hypothetical protein
VQDQDFAIASLLLQDQQRLIAAGKVQRWDVVKWTIAINLALATASVSIGKPGVGVIIVFFTVLVAAAGVLSRFSLQQAHNRREEWF